MGHVAVGAVVLGSLAVKAAVVFVLTYAGARLAIRHERRSPS